MPRKEAKLPKFFQEALDANVRNIENGMNPKYENLIYEDFSNRDVFSLKLPHKTSGLDIKNEFIFRRWYSLNDRKYVFRKDYSKAKQAMIQSLRKSDYIELNIYDNKLICRILSEEEVKEKKRIKKLKAEQKNKESDAANESGYDSGFNSPESFVDSEQNDTDLVQVVQLDHPYVLSPPVKASSERNGFNDEVQNDSKEAKVIDDKMETSEHNKSEINSNVMDTCLMKIFGDIPECSENDTLEDLFKIPKDQFISSNFMELQITPQVPCLTDAKANKSGKSYVCKSYEVMDEVLLLACELFEEMDAAIADTSDSIRIIYEDRVQTLIQDYSSVKDLLPIDDHYLVVILELPFIR